MKRAPSFGKRVVSRLVQRHQWRKGDAILAAHLNARAAIFFGFEIEQWAGVVGLTPPPSTKTESLTLTASALSGSDNRDSIPRNHRDCLVSQPIQYRQRRRATVCQVLPRNQR